MTDQAIAGRDPARSRRTLLLAAVGSAGALAAHAAMAPASVLGHDPDDVLKGADNPTTAATSITNSAGTAQAPLIAVVGASTGNGTGVHGFSGAPGSAFEDPLAVTGVFGSASGSDSQGVVGFAAETAALTSVGVFGSGDNGVIGEGTYGVVGVGHIAVQGLTTTADPGATAVYGEAADNDQYALQAIGRVRLSRSGRVLAAAGKSSVKVSLAAVSSATHVLAQIGSRRAGYYIESAVPTSGSFTIYLNRALAQDTYIHWVVLDA